MPNISEKPVYGFMADETTDVSTKDQMSINFRVVNDDMTVEESFCCFYEFTKFRDVVCTSSKKHKITTTKCTGKNERAKMQGYVNNL